MPDLGTGGLPVRAPYPLPPVPIGGVAPAPRPALLVERAPLPAPLPLAPVPIGGSAPVKVLPIAGAPGRDGAAGGFSAIETLIAGETVSGHRVVASQQDGAVRYASNDNLPDASRQLWLTLQAATAGDSVQCQAYGRVAELGWAWDDGAIFLGANGVLTQTPPALPDAVFFLQVAASDGPTALVFDPRNPFKL